MFLGNKNNLIQSKQLLAISRKKAYYAKFGRHNNRLSSTAPFFHSWFRSSELVSRVFLQITLHFTYFRAIDRKNQTWIAK